MRLLCKFFETLKIDEESHADQSHRIKKCVGIIYRYVTNVMCTLLILRHVSADSAFSIWNASGLNKLQTFIIFVTT